MKKVKVLAEDLDILTKIAQRALSEYRRARPGSAVHSSAWYILGAEYRQNLRKLLESDTIVVL